MRHLAADDLLRVTDDGDVRVVRYDNNLAPLLRCHEYRNEMCDDGLVVQVTFWLVDDKRLVTLIDDEVENQKENSSLPRRKKA